MQEHPPECAIGLVVTSIAQVRMYGHTPGTSTSDNKKDTFCRGSKFSTVSIN